MILGLCILLALFVFAMNEVSDPRNQSAPTTPPTDVEIDEISERVHQKVLEREVEQETYDALREMKDAIDKERIRRKLYGE